MTPTLAEAAVCIKNATKIAVVTHISPDPDAIGSLVGLGTALLFMDKDVVLLCSDPMPQSLTFLSNADRVLAELPAEFTPDLLISLDASDADRLGEVGAGIIAAGVAALNVDHHITNEQFGDINLVQDRASTAEIILGLLDALQLPLTAEIAKALMVGIVGDTRGFSTSNVSPETLRDAARLVEAGVDVSEIVDLVITSRSYNSLRAWGLGLEKIRLNDSVIWATLPLGRRRKLGLDGAGSKGLSNFLLTAREANISAVFTELPKKQVEISMRARPGYDVASIARQLGGGGHKLAAGCTLDGSLENVTKQVVALLTAHAKQESVPNGLS